MLLGLWESPIFRQEKWEFNINVILSIEKYGSSYFSISMDTSSLETKKMFKCKQCDYASFQARDIMSHLKTHFEEKLQKCRQCPFASVWAVTLKNHVKTHSGEKSHKCNQCDYASGRQFEDTLKDSLWRKILQMRSMWICDCSCGRFEETLESSFWREIVQMQPMRLCIC